jgi:hypothetical protein
VHYIQREMYERRILKYIAREFKFDDPAKEIASEVANRYFFIYKN